MNDKISFSGVIAVPDKSLSEYNMRDAANYSKKMGRELTASEFSAFKYHKKPKKLVFTDDGKVAFA